MQISLFLQVESEIGAKDVKECRNAHSVERSIVLVLMVENWWKARAYESESQAEIGKIIKATAQV